MQKTIFTYLYFRMQVVGTIYKNNGHEEPFTDTLIRRHLLPKKDERVRNMKNKEKEYNNTSHPEGLVNTQFHYYRKRMRTKISLIKTVDL